MPSGDPEVTVVDKGSGRTWTLNVTPDNLETVRENYTAVEPFEITGIQTTRSNGLLSVKNKNELVASRVVIGSEKFRAGDIVYMYGEVQKAESSRQVFEVEGRKFVFVADNLIYAVRRRE